MKLLRKIAAAALPLSLMLNAGSVSVSADDGTIHPGVQTYTEGAQCTANFVFSDGVDVFIGQAAHCSGTGAANETNGCLAESLPLGTKVEIDGASEPGTMVYNSWLTMQGVRETDSNTCNYNDFALIKLAAADRDNVSPTIPVVGGPVCTNTDGVDFGESVYSYGNSSLRFSLLALSPKEGMSLGTTGGGWTHPVYTVTPGIPGDSGSAFVDSNGCALGVLSTVAIAPLPASNNVSDLSRALAYMKAHTALDAVQLQMGGAFAGGKLF